MAFDACMMRAVVGQIREQCRDGKVEKILQPASDEIDILIHAGGAGHRIVCNVGPNAPRLQLSQIAKENPLKAPMFCMLLRKKLGGAKLLSVEQVDFDRIAIFTFSAYDEMGFSTECKLICEIMGKYANLILTDKDLKIIAAIKYIDFSDSDIRQILPGLHYERPAAVDKISPIDVDRDTFLRAFDAFSHERTGEKFLTTTFAGLATQTAHETVFRACGNVDVPLTWIDREKLYLSFESFRNCLLSAEYTPTVFFDAGGKPKEYSLIPLTYLSADGGTRYGSLSEMFDVFFAERDRIEKVHQRAHDLLNLISNAQSRTEKKIGIQQKALEDSERAEEYKRAGDLITANIYRLKRGETLLRAVDYSLEDMPTVEIALDSRLTPAQNAQKMYKLYDKAKRARTVLVNCIEEWRRELLYLDSVRDALERAQTEDEIVQIRDEMYHAGYASKMKGYTPQKVSKAKPAEYRTSSGYRLLVGRNNTQNDQLTFRIAGKGDLWFHVKDMPGSHVILLCDGEEPTERDYTEAASVAAYHSKATADLVAVDYTRVKNVKKPQGAKPGFVIYKTNFTAFVRPAKNPESVR